MKMIAEFKKDEGDGKFYVREIKLNACMWGEDILTDLEQTFSHSLHRKKKALAALSRFEGKMKRYIEGPPK